MPEAPEVEALTQHLRRQLVGRKVKAIAIYAPRITRKLNVHEFERMTLGSCIDVVERVGKYIFFRDTKLAGRHWGLHLGMTGRLYIDEVSIGRKHEVARISFERGPPLRFHDPRKFGTIRLAHDVLPWLGPDALSPEWTHERFERLVRGTSRPIKSALLDQSRISGIGNIYANEALAEALIHPDRPASSLSPKESGALMDAIRSTLSRAIRFGTSIELDWKGTETGDRLFYFGSSGGSPIERTERFLVYDRATQECGRCQAKIERTVSGGRSNFFCPRCQRAPS